MEHPRSDIRAGADDHRLALLARRADRPEGLAAELGDGAIAIQAHVADRDSLLAAAERVQTDSAARTSSSTTPL
jgi:NADP-dependent 3-hydroxy acid dehydrogenase YdfG